MKERFKRLFSQWEKLLFWAILLLFFVGLAQTIWGVFGDSEGVQSRTAGTPVQKSILNTATVFFGNAGDLGSMGEHPFTFVLRVPERSAQPKPQETPKRSWGTFKPKGTTQEKPTPPAPAPVQTAKADPPKPPSPAPPVKEPPKPKVEKQIEYSGFMTTPSGKRLALVHNVTDKKTSYIVEGAKLGPFEIQGFDKDKLIVSVPGGQTSEIAVGEVKKIVLSE